MPVRALPCFSFVGADRTPCLVAQFRTYKVIYRRYAGLFFTLCVDTGENELACLEAIHLFVEVLDTYFSHVCELDLVWHFHKVYMILDEFILGGEIQVCWHLPWAAVSCIAI
jgi:Clathrin adaptor complex small chain